MSSTRGVLLPYYLFQDETISSTVVSQTVFCLQTEWVLFDVTWANGGTANIVVTVEYDKKEDDWADVDVGSGDTITISGASGQHQLLLNPNIFNKLRIKLTRLAGSADVSVIVSGKGT